MKMRRTRKHSQAIMKIYNFLSKMSDALDFGSQETHDTITMTSS